MFYDILSTGIHKKCDVVCTDMGQDCMLDLIHITMFLGIASVCRKEMDCGFMFNQFTIQKYYMGVSYENSFINNVADVTQSHKH